MKTRLRVLSVVLPLLVLATSAGVSWFFWEKERRDIQQEMQSDFDTRVREAVGLFRERMLAIEQVLHAINGLYASSARVSQEEFSAFVGNLRINSHPGLQGVGYSARLPASGRGHADEELTSAAIYFEPAGATALHKPGADYYAEPSRRPAMELARDTASVAVSNKIKLPEEDAGSIQGGFRMVWPVYRAGAPVATVEQRRAALRGWIFAAFSMDGLLDNILGERANIALEVYDGGDVDSDQFTDTAPDRVGGESSVKLFFTTKRVEMGGYSWTVTARSLPNFTTPIAISKLRLVAGVGGVASVLLALGAWVAMRRRLETLRNAEELGQARDNAEAANRAKSHFLAAASHDLRQPTHALSLFIAALRAMAKRPQVQGAEVGHIASRLQMALDGLGRLLNGLLDVSQLDAGAVEVKAQPIALQQALSEVHNAFVGPAREKGLLLQTAPTRLWVHSDPVVLTRVLHNLVANAVRYTPQGRILVGCRRRPGGMVELQVLDTGIGIPESQRSKIFEDFYQVGNVARDREHGLGLGLAIVQRSVKLLGGQMKVASTPGRGSVFSVLLPRMAPPAVAPAFNTTQPIRIPATPRRTVLVVDDAAEVRDSMQRLLQEWGHTATTAATLAQAVAAAQQHPGIDLIVADYRLAEGVTGTEAVRAVISRLQRTVEAVITTGDTSPERIREAQASGLKLLYKPLDTRQLREVVEGPRARPGV
jgi:signal transduction histidine kinase/CheY-like chemotaxis protein